MITIIVFADSNGSSGKISFFRLCLVYIFKNAFSKAEPESNAALSLVIPFS